MKLKQLLILCLLLCLTACQAPAGPESESTEATEPTTAETTEATTAPTEPETEPPTEPETEPPVFDVFDFAEHPIHGYMSMTAMERAFTLAVERREIDILARLMDDPRYLDICGGFAYRGGTMYIFSLDDTAMGALVNNPTTAAGDSLFITKENYRAHLIPTNISLRDLTALYNQIEADKAKYDVRQTLFMPRYNQIAVVAKDPASIDSDLQKLADESRCIEILPDYIPLPSASDIFFDAMTDRYSDVYADTIINNGVRELHVTNIDRLLEIVGEDSELRLAWLVVQNFYSLVEVEYSLKAMEAARGAAMDALFPLVGGTATSWNGATLGIYMQEHDNPVLQKVVRDAVMAAVMEATGQSGENIELVFVNEPDFAPPQGTA